METREKANCNIVCDEIVSDGLYNVCTFLSL